VFFSNKEGRISKIIKKSPYINGETVLEIIPQYSPFFESVKKNGCNTHPHNFYAQLLAETGIIGFLFLFSILCYVLYAALRQFKCVIFKQKRPLTDYQVCLLAGVLITVWPFTTNGNFFNNWLMIVYSLPAGFYLQSIYSNKNR
jgi:hypothetical protein